MKDVAYYEFDDCALDDLAALTSKTLAADHLRFTKTVEKNIAIYDIASLGPVLADGKKRKELLAEWAWIFGKSSGVLVLRNAYADTAPIDVATATYERIILDEKARDGGGADHFAKAGANDRIWNSLQKLCLEDPETFALYFGNSAIAAVCEAWLGPGYQMTAQVNLVRPGGAAQEAHRDYHLGFQTAEMAARFPAHVHELSPLMTLQGGIAHCDMPVESGPTKLLPFSQLYGPGYMAYRREDFRAHFDDHMVQLPLSKGDAIFFNPALFHAAGENKSSDTQRFVNLLQISTPFGRALEAIDRIAMSKALYPAIAQLRSQNRLNDQETEAAIAAAAEGYSFPTNLDTDPPVGGLVPKTQAELFHQALSDGMTAADFNSALDAQEDRRTP
jgi:ectoine hydroxylase-related dioxygenase (phytanoyl-CoA dioxygenase family)